MVSSCSIEQSCCIIVVSSFNFMLNDRLSAWLRVLDGMVSKELFGVDHRSPSPLYYACLGNLLVQRRLWRTVTVRHKVCPCSSADELDWPITYHPKSQ